MLASGERGSVLVEVMVSAVLVALMAGAVFGAFNGTARVSSINKARAAAGTLAQDDQEQLRGLPVSQLSNLRRSTPAASGSYNYVVSSRADWIADSSGRSDFCTSNGGSADYLKITSTVTSTNVAQFKPVVVTSTVTPPPGTFSSTQGSLAVQVTDRNGAGSPGIPVTITGPTTATDTTDVNGCAFFGFEPAGSYTVTATQSGYVDKNGNTTASINASIAGQAVATAGLQYDQAGSANVSFSTRRVDSSGTAAAAQASNQRYLTISNSGLVTPGTKTVGTGTATAQYPLSNLFPFTSAYGAYAGNCAKNDPLQYSSTYDSITVLPGGSSAPVVRVPSLNVLTQRGTTTTGAMRVKISGSASMGCPAVSWTENSGDGTSTYPGPVGMVPDPGAPFGTWDACADTSNIVGTSSSRFYRLYSVDATTLPGNTPVTLAVPSTGSVTHTTGALPYYAYGSGLC